MNLVQNIGFDSQATHTVEHDFAGLKMHNVQKMTFPICQPCKTNIHSDIDNKVFESHYKKLEGRRSIWKKLRDQICKKKLTLPEVTLVCVATNKISESLLALKYSQKNISFAQTLFFTSNIPVNKIKNIKCIKIKPFRNIEDWGKFIVYNLFKYIQTKYILLIHADGFVVNPKSWSEKFLNYDYIGAPWPIPGNKNDYHDSFGVFHRVGNSVSLRSKKLLEAPSKLKIKWKNEKPGLIHEDGFICVQNRRILKENGIKFAPFELACRFSRETELPENVNLAPFAFHKWQGKNVTFPFNPKANWWNLHIDFFRKIIICQKYL